MNNINTESLTDNNLVTERKMIDRFSEFIESVETLKNLSPRTNTPSLAARWLGIPYGKEHTTHDNIEESLVIKNYLEYKRNLEAATMDVNIRKFYDERTEIAFKTLLPEVIKSQVPDNFPNRAQFIQNLDTFLDPYKPNIYLSIEKGNEIMCFLSTLLPLNIKQYLAHNMPQVAHWAESTYYRLIITTNNEAATILEPNSIQFRTSLKTIDTVSDLQRYKDLYDIHIQKATTLRANLAYAREYIKNYIGFHTEQSGYSQLLELINQSEAYLDKSNLSWNKYMSDNYYPKLRKQSSQPPTEEIIKGVVNQPVTPIDRVQSDNSANAIVNKLKPLEA